MKITKEEFENGVDVTDANPLDLFRQGIGAEATRTLYTCTLRRILCDILEDVLEGTFEQRAAQFVKLGADEPDRMLGLLLRISRKLRERCGLPHDHPDYMNPVGMQNYFQADQKAARHERRNHEVEPCLYDLSGVPPLGKEYLHWGSQMGIGDRRSE